MTDYLKQKQYIAKVNKKGDVIGKIEKWEAHKKGVLHKALSITLIYKNKYIIQHRKHPAFDGVFDLSSSTHQIYLGNKLEDTTQAAIESLKREWDIHESDLIKLPKLNGAIYYKAKDKNSIFIEHEYCEMLTVEIKKLPIINLEFTYGFSVASKKEILNQNSYIYKNLAPWSKKALKEKLI